MTQPALKLFTFLIQSTAPPVPYSPCLVTSPSGQDLLKIDVSRLHSGHITLGRTPLEEWSARNRGLYLSKHHIPNTQISTQPAVFEPAIPARERPQSHTLDSPDTGIGACALLSSVNTNLSVLTFTQYSRHKNGRNSCMLTAVYFCVIWVSCCRMALQRNLFYGSGNCK